MRRLSALAALILTTLAACSQTGGISASDIARNGPLGVNAHAKGVDGLLVGHRLMEAGEYDLALRAYLRAAGEQGMNADVLSAIAATIIDNPKGGCLSLGVGTSAATGVQCSPPRLRVPRGSA